MSDKHWSEVAAEAAMDDPFDDVYCIADAIRTALAGAGYTVIKRDVLDGVKDYAGIYHTECCQIGEGTATCSCDASKQIRLAEEALK